MDFVLLAVLLQLAVLFLPKLFDEAVEKEFQELLANAAMLSPDDHFDTEKMARFIEDSGVSTKTLELMALIVVSASCILLYWRGMLRGQVTRQGNIRSSGSFKDGRKAQLHNDLDSIHLQGSCNSMRTHALLHPWVDKFSRGISEQGQALPARSPFGHRNDSITCRTESPPQKPKPRTRLKIPSYET